MALTKKDSKKKSRLQPLKKQPVIKPIKIKSISDDFPIVGIGASAGGLEAIQEFFTHVPKKSGMAYIVVTHLDPNHTSMMPELIKSHTEAHVVTIVDDMEVLPDTIYIIPPRKNLLIRNGFYA
ncbi:MAG: chemotaxis protein CheB [Gammaproteobacteria bacterium]|nr:chemotaxis protein CheB [Gammaproteobacteria bacterium]